MAHIYGVLVHQHFETGTYVLFAVLCGSASYIAVPAVQRLAIPEASPTLPLAASLGLTFSYNVTVGIPVYIVIAKEERRADALAAVQRLRDAGRRVDYALTPIKVGKQFQAAEQLGAQVAVLFGDEWPQVKIKTLATREEELVASEELLAYLSRLPSFSSRAT